MRYSFEMPSLHSVRKIEKGLSTTEVAMMLNKSRRWVTNHKDKFILIPNGRSLKFELASVLEYHFTNQQ